MTLKQVLWVSPKTASPYSFFYIETNSEYWWRFSSILQFCKLATSPSRVLKKYGVSKQVVKQFQDFQLAKPLIPKQTVFVSTTTVLNFLNQWKKTQDVSMEEVVSSLTEMLRNPHGTEITQFKKVGKSKQNSKRTVSQPSPVETALIAIVRTSLTTSVLAQQCLTTEKTLHLADIQLLKEFQSQISEYIDELASYQTFSNDEYIDIESTVL